MATLLENWKLLVKEIKAMMKESEELKAENDALKANLKIIQMEASDALHSLHYGTIERETLQKVFHIISINSKKENEG